MESLARVLVNLAAEVPAALSTRHTAGGEDPLVLAILAGEMSIAELLASAKVSERSV